MSAVWETAAKIGQPVCERGKGKRNRTTKTSVVVFGQHHYFRNRFYTLKSHVLLRLENVKHALQCTVHLTRRLCANVCLWQIENSGMYQAMASFMQIKMKFICLCRKQKEY